MEVQPPIDEFLPDDVAVVSTTAPSRTSLFSGFQRSKPLKSKLVEGISSTADRMRNVSFLRGKTEKHKAEPVVPCVSSIWNWEFTPTMTDPRWLPSEAHEVHKSADSSIQISSGCELVFTTSQDPSGQKLQEPQVEEEEPTVEEEEPEIEEEVPEIEGEVPEVEEEEPVVEEENPEDSKVYPAEEEEESDDESNQKKGKNGKKGKKKGKKGKRKHLRNL